MSIDIYAECERAKFLDWLEANKEKVWEYLLLEYEAILFNIYLNERRFIKNG